MKWLQTLKGVEHANPFDEADVDEPPAREAEPEPEAGTTPMARGR